MIHRTHDRRSGITLTEVLISIMILGVGVISLATLFPIGLVRLHNAQRLSRGAFLAESAASDLAARNLLASASFTNPFISPWYQSPSPGGPFNPWVQDTPTYGSSWVGGASRSVGPGLPVCYDPLWRCVTGSYPDSLSASTPEGRFGSGIGFLRNDSDGGLASGHGLQRITNLASFFFPNFPANTTLSPYSKLISMPGGVVTSDSQFVLNTYAVLQSFVSPEDVILQELKGQYSDPNTGSMMTTPSTIVPDMTGGAQTNDWRYSWFFTGQQADASNGTVFDGQIVVCESRQFGLDPIPSPIASGTTVQVPTGETVVEAIWGYSSLPRFPFPVIGGSSQGYGSLSASRSVLLRWPSSMPDPVVKVGGWIADVTYERNQPTALGRYFASSSQIYPAQRCFWYQVAKKSEPVPDAFSASYRSMNVWVTSPLQALSLLDFSSTPASPVHVEAALIMPCVVNVYPRTVFTR